ncbi:MAG: EF-P lysine aminoacylase GenX, partial [Proteobacteria bacterium]|nr:EF-P lysine aminoacylase GenX [Pseudomonadota bacterium]
MDDEEWRLSAKADTLKLRATMIRTVRRFFLDRDFLEIETPLRIPAPAPESHIDAVASDDWFLQTSPELCMKRLLAAGYPKIFQICRCFRAGERGSRHLPEFTMLEWYRANEGYEAVMDDAIAMLRLAAETAGATRLRHRGATADPFAPPERLSVAEAFARHAGIDLLAVIDDAEGLAAAMRQA